MCRQFDSYEKQTNDKLKKLQDQLKQNSGKTEKAKVEGILSINYMTYFSLSLSPFFFFSSKTEIILEVQSKINATTKGSKYPEIIILTSKFLTPIYFINYAHSYA